VSDAEATRWLPASSCSPGLNRLAGAYVGEAV